MIIKVFLGRALRHTTLHIQAQTTKLGGGSERHNESQPNSGRSELIAACQVSPGGLSFTFSVSLCEIRRVLF